MNECDFGIDTASRFTRGETMRKAKLLCVMALVGGLLTALTPQASASLFKKHSHHHGNQHQKMNPRR
jgi:hypothetical protein